MGKVTLINSKKKKCQSVQMDKTKCRGSVGKWWAKKRQGLQAGFFSKCAEVADMFAAGHSLAPVAMMLVAGTHSKRDENSKRVDGPWMVGCLAQQDVMRDDDD